MGNSFISLHEADEERERARATRRRRVKQPQGERGRGQASFFLESRSRPSARLSAGCFSNFLRGHFETAAPCGSVSNRWPVEDNRKKGGAVPPLLCFKPSEQLSYIPGSEVHG